jgi:hypothetical protein
MKLEADHLEAIRGRDPAFYHDGRHEEEVALVAQVYPALGIRPWDNADAILAEAPVL